MLARKKHLYSNLGHCKFLCLQGNFKYIFNPQNHFFLLLWRYLSSSFFGKNPLYDWILDPTGCPKKNVPKIFLLVFTTFSKKIPFVFINPIEIGPI